jgi:hypothetical protein
MKPKKEFPVRGRRFADIVLSLGAVLCFLALSYFLYHYAWTRHRQLTSRWGFVLYFVVPALSASGLLASLRLRIPYRINLALFLCSTGLSIYGVEALMTVWSNLPSVIEARNRKIRIASAKAQGIDFDTRTALEVIEHLKRQGTDAVTDFFPMAILKEQPDGTRKSAGQINGAEVLPLAGFSNKVVVFCNEIGKWVTYKSDDHGFNNSNDVWRMPQLDIATVGDSYVEGMCVSGADNFTALIRDRYPATLNLGKQSAGPLWSLAAIKEYATVVKPKAVLWFYYENDIWTDLMNERTSPLLMRYLTPGFSQDLFHQQSQIDRVVADYVDSAMHKSLIKSEIETKLNDVLELAGDRKQVIGLTFNIAKFSELRQRLSLVKGTSQPDPNVAQQQQESARKQLDSMKEDLELFYRILLEARRSVDAWNGKLYFIFLPSWSRYAAGQEPRPERDEVLLAARRAGIPVIDIHPAFIAQQDPLALFPPFPVTSHYNERGHRIVAEEVLRSISVNDR